MTEEDSQTNNKKLCACNCGQPVTYNKYKKRWNVFLKGHCNRREDVKKRRTELVKCSCNQCDELIRKYDSRGKIRKYAKGHNNRGELNFMWRENNHRRLSPRGYIQVKKIGHPNCFTNSEFGQDHRFVMSEYLGRPLEKDEDVHHINGIKDDNRIENLQLISHSEHSTLSNLGRKKKNG